MMLAYVNHKGEKLTLDGWNYTFDVKELLGYTWSYKASNRPGGYGGVVRSFTRPVAEKRISIGVRGPGSTLFNDRMNQILSITEPDMFARKPGKLWLGSQYLMCYLAVSSIFNSHSTRSYFATKTLTILAEDTFWYTEDTKHFHAGTGEVSGNGKKYPGRYPYQYGTGYANSVIINDHYADTPFVLTFFGPCSSPTISIAGNMYGVTTSADEGERIVIDQRELAIYKVDERGGRLNMFENRIKESSPYAPLPAGESQVVHKNNFAFDITMLKQRSEPKWTSEWS